jgi:hypothetical protein
MTHIYIIYDIFAAAVCCLLVRVHALLTLKAATEVGGITVDNFVELVKLFPALLQSCRDFQTLLRQRVVGWEFWMKHTKKRIQNYGGKTYIPLPLIFKKQEAPLRRPEMPASVKRYGVRQEGDEEGGEDEEWGLNEVKPFEQIVQELQEGDAGSVKPRTMWVHLCKECFYEYVSVCVCVCLCVSVCVCVCLCV